MKSPRSWALLCLLAAAAAAGAEAPPPGAPEIAHSSLLTLHGAAQPGALHLWVRRTADAAPLVVGEFATAIDGRSTPATRVSDGGWTVPLANLAAGEHQLAVTVGHDGIRELLEGKFTPAATPAAGVGGLGGNHKQMLWWILNIAIVAVAAIVISRRMS
ncbi:MAG: hypothetical protein JSR36_01750 [Proteobacteria bacterium]|nr:hypothetical protein [Pseudomonadota bacterium]